MIAIGSDHAGYELKHKLMEYLDEKGLTYEDFGSFSDEAFDYPIIGEKVGKSVASGKYKRGILICGTGIGISISANKVKGIRAAVCTEACSAMLSRKHNDTNVLALGARLIGLEQAKMILDTWLTTEFEGGRHARRVKLVDEIIP